MNRALLAALLLLLSLSTACQKNRQQPVPAAPVAAGDSGAAGTPKPREQQAAQSVKQSAAAVVFTVDGKEVRVPVELARTEEERRVGLMYRQHLPPDSGMLFLFDADEVHQFWMKNTLIPLDMIFITADLTVAGVVENAEPRTLTGRTIGKISRHVLEVNAGWAKAHGVGEGTKLRFEQMPEQTTEENE